MSNQSVLLTLGTIALLGYFITKNNIPSDVIENYWNHKGHVKVMAKRVAIDKKTGKDAAAGKATFVSLLGVERAREQAQLLAQQAASHLDIFDDKGKPLRDLAQFVVSRTT